VVQSSAELRCKGPPDRADTLDYPNHHGAPGRTPDSFHPLGSRRERQNRLRVRVKTAHRFLTQTTCNELLAPSRSLPGDQIGTVSWCKDK
jgi:hypothetical protein